MARAVYLYGVQESGCAALADGLIETNDDVLGEYKSVLVYEKPLSKVEEKQYGLDFIGKRWRN